MVQREGFKTFPNPRLNNHFKVLINKGVMLMNIKCVTKTWNKGSSYWKHGKHKGLKEVSIILNKRKKFLYIFETIDISQGNWSSYK